LSVSAVTHRQLCHSREHDRRPRGSPALSNVNAEEIQSRIFLFFCEEVVLSEIPTEVLVKLRERYLSGRTRFLPLEEGGEMECLQQRMIEAIEKEIQRRLDSEPEVFRGE
jgi:hypothetical protein